MVENSLKNILEGSRMRALGRAKKRACFILLLLLALGETKARAEEIISDEFSTSSSVTEEGGTFEPNFSKAGTKWQVLTGQVSSDGSIPSHHNPAGQLAFAKAKKTKILIEFGSVKDDTPASVAFQLRHWDGADANTSYFVTIGVGSKELGAEYSITLSLGSNYFRAKGGGMSGVGISDRSGAHAGEVDARFPDGAIGQSFHDIVVKFDPAEGTMVYLDEQLVGSLGNTEGASKIDYFSISNGGSERLSWLVDNFVVEAMLN